MNINHALLLSTCTTPVCVHLGFACPRTPRSSVVPQWSACAALVPVYVFGLRIPLVCENDLRRALRLAQSLSTCAAAIHVVRFGPRATRRPACGTLTHVRNSGPAYTSPVRMCRACSRELFWSVYAAPVLENHVIHALPRALS